MSAPAHLRPAGPVRLSSAGLDITGLRITDDQDVLTAARAAADRGEDLTTWVRTALRAGAVAITAAGSGTDLTRLHQALERVASDVDGRVQHCVSRLETAVTSAVDPHHGQLATASQAAVTRLAEGVSRLLTGPDATVPATVQAAVRAVTDTALAEITRSLAATSSATQRAIAADRDAVRRDVLQAVQGQYSQLSTALTQIREDVAVRTAVAQSRAHSSAKGVDYEADCLITLGAVAARAGDGGATNVGTTRGHDGTMVGDLVVELTSIADPGPVFVAECKSRSGSNRLSLAEWRKELRAAASNRNASVSLGLCHPDGMPVPGQRLIVLDERTLVVAHEPAVDGPDDPVLTAAFLLLRLTATTAQFEQRDDVDLTEAHRQLTDLRNALTPIGKLELEIGKIDRAGEVIRQTASSLRADLIGRIDKLQTALTT